jgi:hypothetical protein
VNQVNCEIHTQEAPAARICSVSALRITAIQTQVSRYYVYDGIDKNKSTIVSLRLRYEYNRKKTNVVSKESDDGLSREKRCRVH